MKKFFYGIFLVLHSYIIVEVGIPAIRAIWAENPVDHGFRLLITLWLVVGMYKVFPLHRIMKEILNGD